MRSNLSDSCSLLNFMIYLCRNELELHFIMDFILLNPCYTMHFFFFCLYQSSLLHVTICSILCCSSAELGICSLPLNTIPIVMYCAVKAMPLGSAELNPSNLCSLLNYLLTASILFHQTVQSQTPVKLSVEIQTLLKKKLKQSALDFVSFVH